MDNYSPFLGTLQDRVLSPYDASYLASLMTIIWGAFLVFAIAYLLLTGRRVSAPIK